MVILRFVVGGNSTELIDNFQPHLYCVDSINISGGVMTKSDTIKELHNEAEGYWCGFLQDHHPMWVPVA